MGKRVRTIVGSKVGGAVGVRVGGLVDDLQLMQLQTSAPATYSVARHPQLVNENSPIEVAVCAIANDVNRVHPVNARSSIVVTDGGITTRGNVLQSWNAPR